MRVSRATGRPSRWAVAGLALACLSTACAAAPEAVMVVKTLGPSTSRTLALTVMGPATLANGRSFLASASEGPLISRGGLLLGPGDAGAAFRLTQTGPRYLRVEQASVQLQTLSGKPFTPTVFTDGAGTVAVPISKNEEPLAAIAAFLVAGKVYRLAAVVPVDARPDAYMVDPLTTVIEAVVRADRRKPTSVPDYDRLRRVWAALDRAAVVVDPDELQADLPRGSSQARLREIWDTATANQLVSDRDKAVVASFREDLERP